MSDESEENGSGEESEKVQFRRKDGIEKDGYICFPVEIPEEPVEPDEPEEPDKPDQPAVVDARFETCPNDPRYQQQNKTRWCYRMFVDYHRCRHLLGQKASQCDYFYKCYNSICPNSWVEKWDEQIETGNFPYDFTKDLPPKNAFCQ